MSEPSVEPSGPWFPVVALEDLAINRGVAALIGDQQVAVFRTDAATVHAVGNYDPFSRANVLSRGIVGDRNGIPKVASPIYKQSFDLRSGRCLEDPSVAVPVFAVRIADGIVEVAGPT